MLREGKSRLWILWALELLICLLLLPGCFRREELVGALTRDNARTLASEEGSCYRGPDLRLSPGVYQLRVSCETTQEQSLFVDLKDGSAAFKALRGNGVNIMPGQTYSDFEVYVLDTAANAHVECTIRGGGMEVLKSLEIYRLNWGSRMLLFGALAAMGLLNGLVLFRRKILDGVISGDRQIVFWGLTGAVLLAYFPYMTDYFSLGADTGFHLLRIEGLKESLLTGASIPVHVQSYWVYGHGSVVPSMYCDFFLLIPAAFRIIGFSLMTSYKLFVLLLTIATALIAYVSFRACVKDRYIALGGSVLYLLAPYRLYNLYTRGAEGEYMAMTFLPLICCGMYLLYTEDVDSEGYGRHKRWIIAGMSALLLCHPLSAELAAMFMLLVCVLCCRRTFRRATFLQLSQAAAVTVLLNCWYLVPMLYMLGADQYHLQQEFGKSIQESGIQLAGIFQLYPNVGSVHTGMYRCEPIQLGAGGLLFLALYAIVRFCRRSCRERELECLWFLTIAALFLSTKYFPWDLLLRVPGLETFVTAIQFPSRIMLIASALCAMFAVLFLHKLLREEDRLSVRIGVGVMGFIVLGAAVYQVNDLALRNSAVYLHTAENMGTTSSWSRNFIFEGTELEQFCYHGPDAEKGLSWSQYEKAGTNITMEVSNETDMPRHLELPLTGYKGYAVEALAEAEEPPYISEQRGDHGDLRIVIPARYQGGISVRYRGEWFFRLFEAVSLATGGVLIFAELAGRVKTGRRRREV